MSGVTDGLDAGFPPCPPQYQIKQCPFCGSSRWELETLPAKGSKVTCLDCGARTAKQISEIAAQKAWNTRHTPSFADAYAKSGAIYCDVGVPAADRLAQAAAQYIDNAKADDPKERYIARLEALLLKLVQK